jgi:hypothetical protein
MQNTVGRQMRKLYAVMHWTGVSDFAVKASLLASVCINLSLEDDKIFAHLCRNNKFMISLKFGISIYLD